MKLAVQFGAGNIGRGFMGQLFWEAGYRIVFIEALLPLVHLLNKKKKYPLKLLDAYSESEIGLTIDRVEAVDVRDTELVAQRVSQADVIGTAVGVKNLTAIAVSIARGIKERHAGGKKPVDIYLCENVLNAADILHEEVEQFIPQEEAREWIGENIGFVGTVVARMVPARGNRFVDKDPLFVVADSYHKLPYDGKAVRAEQPNIEGMRAVDNFKAEVERKLFTYNLGHAALAYLGFLKGYSYVHEPFGDEFLMGIFQGALDETSRAILKLYPDDLDPEEHKEIRKDVDARFGNPMIMDTVQRVARDPIRKLGRNDRIVGSANLCLSQGIFPHNIARVCGAALCYDFLDDPEAVLLQKKIDEKGVELTLREISGVDPVSALGKRIVEYYKELQELRKKWRG